MNDPLSVILGQIEEAAEELRAYGPADIDWSIRSAINAKFLIPWLVQVAPGLREFVEQVINSPENVRKTWAQVKRCATIPSDLAAKLDSDLEREKVLLGEATGDLISSVISTFLIDHHPTRALESNGRSDYPDLFVKTYDYSRLPLFQRSQKAYGAALKGQQRRPVRIADGLEIKTCRDRVAVDCHHPHIGLHLVLLFRFNAQNVATVNDVLVAFLSVSDYRHSARNTTATTDKYSFGASRFVSLLVP